MKKSRVHTVWTVFKWMNFAFALSKWDSEIKAQKTHRYTCQVQYTLILESVNITFSEKSFISILCSRFVECPTNDYKIFNGTRLHADTHRHTYPHWLKAWHLQIFLDHFNGWAMSIHAIFFIRSLFCMHRLNDRNHPWPLTASFFFLFPHTKADWNWNFPFCWFCIPPTWEVLLPRTPSHFQFSMSHLSTIFRYGISNVQLDSKIVCDWRFVA